MTKNRLMDLNDHLVAQLERLGDARAACRILARLIADGRLPEAKVHYARNPPVRPADAPVAAVEGQEAAG